MKLKIAVTGHRPDKLGGFNNVEGFKAIRRNMKEILGSYDPKDITAISGGALGIDQFWIEVALHLSIPVIAALPFKGYDAKWPIASRRIYTNLLASCKEVKYICDAGYEPSKLQRRNEWMVNNCDLLVAYWNGTPGGTANCVRYAESITKEILKVNVNYLVNEK